MKKLLFTLASVAMLAVACQEPEVDNPQDPDQNQEQPQNPEQNPDDGYQAPTPPDEPTEDYDGLTRLEFEESDKIFANPERGFYKHYDFLKSSASPLSVSALKSHRLENNITLVYIGHYLTEFVKSDISDKFLQLVRKNMQALRDAGTKCVLRFAYTNDQDKKPWDAKPEWVARHIEQLKPILQEYSDVILCFQSGFIGVWGEGYYTDNFVFEPETPEEHSLRKEVVDAMLDAIPTDRQVALRTPMFKRMMYADSYTDTLTLSTAYNGTPKARICGFNDCFGASADDYGTFAGSETREYWKKDTRYVLMGGETCGLSDYCRCKQSLKDMEDYHWTYMNSGYNASVLDRWTSDGCMDEVKRRLGYRLSLSEAYHSPEAVPGQDYRVVLKIRNTGFAAPMNRRGVELVLVDGNGNKTVYECSDVEPRYWFANMTATIDKTITLPADLEGDFSLYLNLPDPMPILHDNPLFSIRLANDGVWDEKTGYNKLF